MREAPTPTVWPASLGSLTPKEAYGDELDKRSIRLFVL